MITVINHAGSYKAERRGTYPNSELENLCLWIAGGGFNERQVQKAMLIANAVRESGAWSDKQLTINRTTDENSASNHDEANDAFYTWERANNEQDLSDRDRLLWTAGWIQAKTARTTDEA